MNPTDTPRWHQWLVTPRIIFAGIFLISTLVYLALIPVPRVDGQLIGSDGISYYIYARSLILDHDLDFANDYTLFDKSAATTNTGRVANKYAIGPALLWLPFFLVAHLIALVGQGIGLPIVPDGTSYLYQAAISIGSIAYGTAGLWLAFTCARHFFPQTPALLATVLIWSTSNVVYYMILEPSMAHMVSLFSVSLLLSIWFWSFRTTTTPPVTHAIALGASGGIVMLVRAQDAVFLLLPYTFILVRFIRAWLQRDTAQRRHWFITGLIVLATTLIVYSPQLLTWKYLYGTWSNPYLSDHSPAFYWFQPKILSVLFSSFHGLFSWHPIFLVAFIGFASSAPKDLWFARSMLIVWLLNLYIVAAWWAWWQGDSFGGRMFINATWIWVMWLTGMAALFWQHRQFHTGVVIFGILLLVWNGLALTQYRLGFVPMSEPLTWQQMTIDRITLPWTLLQKLLT